MGDGIGETYQYVPASPGIGDSAISSCLTPEYRLLCPSGMNDWLCTARQSKKLTSIGTLTLGVKDHLYQVKTGCSATARTDVPHFYENQEEGPLVFIMTVHEKTS